jgi:hypothetical protein
MTTLLIGCHGNVGKGKRAIFYFLSNFSTLKKIKKKKKKNSSSWPKGEGE